MPAYLWPPKVVDGDVEVSTSEIVDDVRLRLPDVPWLPRVDAIAASTGIRTRRWAQPLAEVTARSADGGDRTVEERTGPAWAAVQDMGERAARKALDAAGVGPGDIDCLITSHSTTPALPGLDIALAERLGLRGDVLLLPAAQWACIAGTRSLAVAARLLAGDPDMTVLVVVSEALSTTYQPSADGMDALLTRLLFCDSAGSAVVRGRPGEGACLRLGAAWHHTLPGTSDQHRLHTRWNGSHFVMQRSGPRTVQRFFPPLWEWLAGGHPEGWHPDLLLAHPGGTRVLEYIEETLPDGWPHGMLRYSWESYSSGNRGGVAVLDILGRACGDRQEAGARTVLFAAAPGATATALDAEWL